jgi:4-hydroxybenzoate polyprenyltransferase
MPPRSRLPADTTRRVLYAVEAVKDTSDATIHGSDTESEQACSDEILVKPDINLATVVLIAGAAFALYLFSAVVLAGRGGTSHFGADAHLYAVLADGEIIDRIVRFHPVTVVLAVGWLKLFAPLVSLDPHILLKMLFALVGAAGVGAAAMTFSVFLPRVQAIAWSAIYAVSLGVWYFASIEESKIVTATLAAIYLAIYVRLRQQWTLRGAISLTVVLALACLNEIVSCFLVAIPVIDTLVRYGWNWREGRWIGAHALVAPVAFGILEGVISRVLLTPGTEAEGKSHFSMLFFYVFQNDFKLSTVYEFAVNWLFFNIVAPTPAATMWEGAMPDGFKGYFFPVLSNYLTSPITGAVVVLAVLMAVVIMLPGYRTALGQGVGALLAAVVFQPWRSAAVQSGSYPCALADHRCSVRAHIASRQRSRSCHFGRLFVRGEQRFHYRPVMPKQEPSIFRTLRHLLRSCRLHQWAKNLLIFAPGFLGGRLDEFGPLLASAQAFLALGLVASSTYLINDILDAPDDRKHWSKCNRPIAAGLLPLPIAWAAAAIGMTAGFALATWVSQLALVVMLVYVGLTLSYSLGLKRLPLVDGLVLAILYTLRLGLGVAAAEVPPSPWLFVFSMFLFTSLSFAKRYTELDRSGVARGQTIRGRGYRAEDTPLVLAVGVAAGLGAVIIMVQYIIEDAFRQSFYGSTLSLWGFPILVFLIVGRMWLVTVRGEMHDDPVAFMLRDRASQALLLMFAICFLFAWLNPLPTIS